MVQHRIGVKSLANRKLDGSASTNTLADDMVQLSLHARQASQASMGGAELVPSGHASAAPSRPLSVAGGLSSVISRTGTTAATAASTASKAAPTTASTTASTTPAAATVDSTNPSERYPLPEGWSKEWSEPHRKCYFYNRVQRVTSWVDPRDAYWKKRTWAECAADTAEVPYGWEIARDPIVGRYFIDHNSGRNLLDDPRSTTVSTQLSQMHGYLREQHDAVVAKETEVRQKAAAITALVAEIQALRDQIGKTRGPDRQVLTKQLASLSQQLRALTDEHAALKESLVSMKADVDDMKALADRLAADQTLDQVEQQKRVVAEIEALKQQISEEEKSKQAVEKRLVDLQNKYKLKNDVEIVQIHISPAVMNAMGIFDAHGASRNAESPAGGENRTRLEREMELLHLKKRLAQEQRQRAYLEALADKAKNEIAFAMHQDHNNLDLFGRPVVPQWVKTLNNYANASATVRSHIQGKANAAGEALSFREKMLLFTSQNQDQSLIAAEIARMQTDEAKPEEDAAI
ncbi:hypothetical protein CXG81DRAFT_19880 [Caulochytrium protostelioides]|uniref:WW domain-containing protein n=1 Tax=Caulochytrium protostelioides TaxID=1555241 RepID=A0A4P9X4V8_9FUNG|nr:hypothetical protein CXG81DRAFT_19880 [Caulochytrium protostelioides]|eukprot:RKP00114.1 hypothetical protein CXG81DRAFT_19880 [Caulochytrium protostelioides]